MKKKKDLLLNRKIWSRRSSILPEFVNCSVRIYNGKSPVRCKITEGKVGHKFGEFASTRILKRIFLFYFSFKLWGWAGAIPLCLCSDVLEWVLSAIGDLPLYVGGDGGGPSSWKGPPFDLNLPAEGESAPPSDPRSLELEDENRRLRQENAELHRALGESHERIEGVLNEAERHIRHLQQEQEQHRARRLAWTSFREEMCRDIQRWQALERENARLRFRLQEINFKKRGPLLNFKWFK